MPPATRPEGSEPRAALSSADLVELLGRTREAFAVHRAEIDALNVFPVPDGDTGTNLLLTVEGVLEELDGRADIPRSVTRGALRSARGNSGVIFSQVLRGLAETVGERGTVGPDGVSEALDRARRYAYDAVADPVEGTMLTAVRVAAETAGEAVSADLTDQSDRVAAALAEAVAGTTDQLEALRLAGVVDAGARGFEVFWAELRGLVNGTIPRREPPAVVARRSGRVTHRESGSPDFRYEVQYLLDAPEDAAPSLRRRLGELGDSVVVVASDGLVNVHVHTNDIGPAIEAGAELGRPSRITVVEFADQIAASSPPPPAEITSLGCVAVVPGAGLAEVVRRHRAVPVLGGPGELPSVADILNAVSEVHAERVVILPGHPNVVPAARQAVAVAEAEGGRPLEVLEAATSVPALLAALAVLDRDGEPGRTLVEMRAAASASSHAEVVPAIRDADTPIGHVVRGQYLAVCDGEVCAVTDDPVDALLRLVDACRLREAELVTVVLGSDVDSEERERAMDALRDAAPGVQLDVIDGGQTSARYLLGVE